MSKVKLVEQKEESAKTVFTESFKTLMSKVKQRYFKR